MKTKTRKEPKLGCPCWPYTKLVKLIKRKPGRNAQQLGDLGWTYRTHGSLKAAEDAGLIVWDGEGWYVA